MWWKTEPDQDEARALRAANGADVHSELFNVIAQWGGLFALCVITAVMAVRSLVE